MQELLDATRAHLAGEPQVLRVLPHPYAFNLFSHDTPIDPETGGNGEETKVVNLRIMRRPGRPSTSRSAARARR